MDWDQDNDYDIVINATSLGLNVDDKPNFNFNNLKK